MAIGFTRKKLGDDRIITASCSVKVFSISVMNPSAADVSSLQMDSWKRRLGARQCKLSARGEIPFLAILRLVASRSADSLVWSVLCSPSLRNFIHWRVTNPMCLMDFGRCAESEQFT